MIHNINNDMTIQYISTINKIKLNLEQKLKQTSKHNILLDKFLVINFADAFNTNLLKNEDIQKQFVVLLSDQAAYVIVSFLNSSLVIYVSP